MATRSLLWTLCLLNLCVVVLVEGADRNCFNTACEKGDSLAACVAGHWQCHHGEVCLMDIKHDSSVSMICVAANHAKCPHANHNQDASCAPLVYPPQHDCVYCCDTEQCARNIEAGMVFAIHPPQQGCFSGLCDHHANLESCLQGQWQCNANQFCRFDAHRNGDIVMHCQDTTDQGSHCQDANIKNPDTCSRLDTLPPPSDCRYCCTDQSCIVNILTSSLHTTTTPAPTTPAPTTTTPAPTTTPAHGHLPHAGKASCFTSDCEHVDIAQCISGQWACTAHQHCHVQGQPDGTLHMNCDDIAHYVKCLTDHFSHNAPECQVSIQNHCQYCCNDADCVRRLASVPATQPPATTTTKSTSAPTIATAAPTATPAPSTLTPAPTTSTPATTTAPTMPPATTTPAPTTLVCMDNLPNNGCSLVMRDCTDLTVMEVCRKTCGVCGSSSVHTTAATASPSQTATATASPVQATSSTQSPTQTTAAPTQITAAPTQTTTTTPSPTQTAATASPTTATTSDPHTTHPHNAVTTPPQLHQILENLINDALNNGVVATTVAAATTAATVLVHGTSDMPTTVCEDHYAGDCSVDFAGRCGEETIGHFLCPKFCGTCNTLPCRDLFTGDCSVTFAGRCNEPAIVEICRQTCGCAAPMTTTTVVVPTTTDGCIDKFHGDCSVALNGLCSYEVVADLCQKTCNTCGSGSNSATTTSSNSGHLIG